MYYVYCWGQATQSGCWWLINCIEKTEGGKLVTSVWMERVERKKKGKVEGRQSEMHLGIRREKTGKELAQGLKKYRKIRK